MPERNLICPLAPKAIRKTHEFSFHSRDACPQEMGDISVLSTGDLTDLHSPNLSPVFSSTCLANSAAPILDDLLS